MRNLSIKAFAKHLGDLAERMPQTEYRALDAGARIIEAEAKAEIGEYQPAVKGFPAWKHLTLRTLYGGVSPTGYHYPGKVELGYAPPDNPLLRTGALRNSIGRRVGRHEAFIGSDSEVAEWQEFGTRGSAKHIPIPPRSFIGRAAAVHGHEVVRMMIERIMRGLVSGRR